MRYLLLVLLIVVVIATAMLLGWFFPSSDTDCWTSVEDTNDFSSVLVDHQNNTIIVGKDNMDRLPKTMWLGVEEHDDAENILIAKFDNFGELIFSLALGGREWEQLIAVDLDSNDNMILAIRSSSSDFLGGDYALAGSRDFLVKLSSMGQLLWVKEFDILKIKAMQIFPSDQILVAGDEGASSTFYNVTRNVGSFHGSHHAVLMTFNKEGNLNDYVQIHGRGDVFTQHLAIDANSSIYLSLLSNGNELLGVPAPIINNSFENIEAIIKLNKDYALQWINPQYGVNSLVKVNKSLVIGWLRVFESSLGYVVSRYNETGGMMTEFDIDLPLDLNFKFKVFNSKIYILDTNGIYLLNMNTKSTSSILLSDPLSRIFDFQLHYDKMIIMGETSNQDLIDTSTYQATINGTQDLYIGVYQDTDNVIWGTYFGGNSYEVTTCISY